VGPHLGHPAMLDLLEGGDELQREPMRLSVRLRQRAKAMPDSTACVVVIDGDRAFLESLGRLLRSVGLHPYLFPFRCRLSGIRTARRPYLSRENR
jgi:hypothetical protein